MTRKPYVYTPRKRFDGGCTECGRPNKDGRPTCGAAECRRERHLRLIRKWHRDPVRHEDRKAKMRETSRKWYVDTKPVRQAKKKEAYEKNKAARIEADKRQMAETARANKEFDDMRRDDPYAGAFL